jgi:hypothetical protein
MTKAGTVLPGLLCFSPENAREFPTNGNLGGWNPV